MGQHARERAQVRGEGGVSQFGQSPHNITLYPDPKPNHPSTDPSRRRGVWLWWWWCGPRPGGWGARRLWAWPVLLSPQQLPLTSKAIDRSQGVSISRSSSKSRGDVDAHQAAVALKEADSPTAWTGVEGERVLTPHRQTDTGGEGGERDDWQVLLLCPLDLALGKRTGAFCEEGQVDRSPLQT